MAEQLTKQQAQAVYDRGGRLLVSAAAGSGKTKVLVDRLLCYITDPADPADIDDFLIITYTKAAASELRGKIAAKMTELLAQNPQNKHLLSQMQRLYLTKISTVHAFCADLLREYAYHLDIPADFRMADENECVQLREKAVAMVLENAYAAQDDPDFRAFVNTQGLGRDDRLVPQIVLQVYDSARCHPEPEAWLQKCLTDTDVSGCTDAAHTVWGSYLMTDLFSYVDLQMEALENCAKMAYKSEGFQKPAALLEETVRQLRCLRQCTSWDAVVACKDIDYGTLRFGKSCTDLELIERIKAVREACKKGMQKKLRRFSDSSAQIMQDLARSMEAARGMVALVREFDREYTRLKKVRRVLDFGDLEHRALDLLLGKNRSDVTAVAREVAGRFREIMVDEYQDSNAIQDAIFMALTQQRHNLFMVGDVKQSIYQFRLADPQIFLQKYDAYAHAENADPMQGRKVLLTANFRSGGGVLAGVNDVFRCCMSPTVGGLVYAQDEQLREGIAHIPLGEPEVELLAVDVKEETYPEEAAVVAHRVRQLLSGDHFVRQGETLRPVQPEDIAILLRSPGSSGSYYRDALEKLGIRTVSGGGEDLLQTEEVALLWSLLQTISNPRQDIALIATLAGPVFAFTADDLAAIRAPHKSSSFYDALCRWEHPKGKAFVETLQALRKKARSDTLAALLEEIFCTTGMEQIFAAMPGGAARRSNLLTFYSLAVDYESTARRDLDQFLDHLQTLSGKGLIAAGEERSAGAVTIMSIHKSKGLEFPVVIVAGLSREFNRESLRDQVMCDRMLGLGLSAVDEKNRVRYPTLSKQAIAVNKCAESLSEEMRVLYVALTRARDKLIMSYASRTLEADLRDIALRSGLGNPELLTRDVVCPGQWVLMAAMERTEAGELFALGGKPAETKPGTPAWSIRVVSAPDPVTAQVHTEEEMASSQPLYTMEQMQDALSFRYPYQCAVDAPSKQTATQRKGRDKDEEAAEHTQNLVPHYIWRKPDPYAMPARSTEAGKATHLLLQFLCFENCDGAEGVRQEVQRLVCQGFLKPEQGDMIDCEAIASLFRTELGQKLRRGQVLREFKFSILDDGSQYNSALAGEHILLQGVVDCALMEPDGITVVDFKTDTVTEENLDERVAHYRAQVLAYADAMSRIYQQKVKATYLYFFRLGRFVQVM